MDTTYLRFPDEPTAKSALAPYVAPDGSWIVSGLDHALDPVGTLYASYGVYDEDGEQIEPPVADDGWHVNLIGAVPDAAAAYIVTPKTPSRVFAALPAEPEG